MSIDPAILRAMVEAGATTEVLLAAVEAAHAMDEAKAAEKRAKDAERQRKSRANREQSRNVTVTARDNADVTESHDGENKSPPDPLKQNYSPLRPLKGAQTPKGVPAQRGSALPIDWGPNEQHFGKAAERNFDRAWVLNEAEAMREWADANRNRPVARKADWDRTFDSWLRKAFQRLPFRPQQAAPQTGDQIKNNVLAIIEARKARAAQ